MVILLLAIRTPDKYKYTIIYVFFFLPPPPKYSQTLKRTGEFRGRWLPNVFSASGRCTCEPLTPTTPNPSNSNGWLCCILMDSVLHSPDWDTLHGSGCPNSSQVQQLGGSVTAWCCILMDSVLHSPDWDTLHGAGCTNSSQVQQLGGSVTAWCCILMDSVLHSPDWDTLHGGQVSQFQPSPTVGW